MSVKVNLTKRVTVGGKDRYCPVVLSANGRLKPDWVVVDGAEERHPEGRYYIDWTAGGKRRRQAVGKSASDAVARQLRKETELKALSQGLAVTSDSAEKSGTDLTTAVSDYLEDTKMTKKPKTISAYTTSLGYFLEVCDKRTVEQIDRRDMLRFIAFLRDTKGQASRSVWNKFNNVMSFLKVHKMNGIVGKRDWPRFTQEEVEVYVQEELDFLYQNSSEDEQLLWDFFLKTGKREQEVMFTTWPDINLNHRTVLVRHKPEYHWSPKAYKEREIPIPDSLCEKLDERVKKSGLVFPSASGKPNGKFLRLLKAKAMVRTTEFTESDFYLHKFRATFATWHLQSGVDIRTVQEWMGHTDIQSTMRYLRPAHHSTVREKVNATFA